MTPAEAAYVEELKAEFEALKSQLNERSNQLTERNQQLTERNQQLTERNQQLTERDQKILHLEEQVDWFKRQIFGKKSERIVRDLDQQQLLFRGFAVEKQEEIEKRKVKAHSRKKRKGQDAITIPEDLPVETTTLDIPEEAKICPITGRPLVKIGEEVSQKLAFQPGGYFIKETIRPKYALPLGEGILMADLPDGILPKVRADESLLADIAVKKYGDHLPLYRQSEMMARQHVGVSRQQLSSWMVSLGEALLPLHKALTAKILSSEAVFMDESPVKVVEKGKCRKGYMWVLVGGGGSDPPYFSYHYRPGRGHKYGLELLSNYTGCLHADMYGVYVKLGNRKQIVWCPCWSHIRRKFEEAQFGDLSFRDHVLFEIQQLFLLERQAWELSPADRLELRQSKAIPVINGLIAAVKARLTSGVLLPQSKYKKALSYLFDLSPYLTNYCYHASSRLDNNAAERAVRPLALGRKNWLFLGNDRSGHSSAALLSLIQTCRNLQVNPWEYLNDTLRRLQSHPMNRLSELLPDAWAASQGVDSPTIQLSKRQHVSV